MTDQQITRALKLRDQGFVLRQVASDMKVPESTLRRFLSGFRKKQYAENRESPEVRAAKQLLAEWYSVETVRANFGSIVGVTA